VAEANDLLDEIDENERKALDEMRGT